MYDSKGRRKCRCTTSSLGTNIDIRVLISGLQALCLYEDYCHVEVLKAPNHEFRIYIDEFSRIDGTLSARRCFAEVPGTYLALATPPTAPQPVEPLSLDAHNPCDPSAPSGPAAVDTAAAPPAACRPGWGKGICKYQTEPFDRDSLEREAFQESSDGTMVGSDDHRDFRWLVDLAGPHFYGNSGARFKREFVSPNFYINKGVFYTAALSSQAFDRVTIRRPGFQHATCGVGDRHHLGRAALVVGANIEVEQRGAALEIWGSPPAHTPCWEKNEYSSFATPGDKVSELFHFDTPHYYYKVALANFHPPLSDSPRDESDFIEYGNALVREENGLDLYHVYDLQPTSRALATINPCFPSGGLGG
jgi:hypothetical protein